MVKDPWPSNGGSAFQCSPPGWRDLFPRLRSFLTTSIQRGRFEDSLDEEIRFHLDAQTENLVRTGLPPAEAASRARMQFGSIEAVKDDCRRVRGLWITGGLFTIRTTMARVRVHLMRFRDRLGRLQPGVVAMGGVLTGAAGQRGPATQRGRRRNPS